MDFARPKARPMSEVGRGCGSLAQATGVPPVAAAWLASAPAQAMSPWLFGLSRLRS